MKRIPRLFTLTLAMGAVALAAFGPLLTAPLTAEEKIILTPMPGPEPRINGARVFGVRPGSTPLLGPSPARGMSRPGSTRRLTSAVSSSGAMTS